MPKAEQAEKKADPMLRFLSGAHTVNPLKTGIFCHFPPLFPLNTHTLSRGFIISQTAFTLQDALKHFKTVIHLCYQ